MLNVQRLRSSARSSPRGSFSEAAERPHLHPVGRLPGDRDARGRGRGAADRARPAGRAADGRGRRASPSTPARILAQLEAAEAELGGDRRGRGRRAADGVLPDRGRDPDAAGDRRASGPRTPGSTSAWSRASRRRSSRGCATASSTSRCSSSSRGRASSGRACGARRCSRTRCSSRCPTGHRACAQASGSRSRTSREEAWVQTSEASACARHVVRFCHAAGFEPRVSFESDDYLTVQGLVAAGVGVALIPQLALSQPSATTSPSASCSRRTGAARGCRHAAAPACRCPPPRRCWRSSATRARAATASMTAPGTTAAPTLRRGRRRVQPSGVDCGPSGLAGAPGGIRQRRHVRGVDLVAVDGDVAFLHVGLRPCGAARTVPPASAG